MRLKWKCDGGCQTILEEGVDHFSIIMLNTPGSPEEGQLVRLCKECTSTQLKRREPRPDEKAR